MSDNPYQSPETSGYQDANPTREAVRRVAKYQRWVIFALLANIGANVVSFATLQQELLVRLGVIALALGVAAFAMCAIFLLTRELVNPGAGVVCAVLMIVPCISLIVLLIVNQKATTYLQSNGVRVGFLGANPDTI